MMTFALNYDKPISIRYPRGEAYDGLKDYRSPIEYGKSEVICNEGGVALFALGSMVKTAEAVRDILKLHSRTCSIINARFAKPLDEELLRKLARDHSLIVTMEENVYIGGMGEQVREFVDSQELGARVLSIALPDDYVEHGNVELLKKETGIDADSAAEKIMEYLGVNNEKQA